MTIDAGCCFLSMSRKSALVSIIDPTRFTFSECMRSASLKRSRSPSCVAPALLTRIDGVNSAALSEAMADTRLFGQAMSQATPRWGRLASAQESMLGRAAAAVCAASALRLENERVRG